MSRKRGEGEGMWFIQLRGGGQIRGIKVETFGIYLNYWQNGNKLKVDLMLVLENDI